MKNLIKKFQSWYTFRKNKSKILNIIFIIVNLKLNENSTFYEVDNFKFVESKEKVLQSGGIFSSGYYIEKINYRVYYNNIILIHVYDNKPSILATWFNNKFINRHTIVGLHNKICNIASSINEEALNEQNLELENFKEAIKQ